MSRWNVVQDEAWELEELEGNKKFKVATRLKKVWEVKEIQKYEKIPTQKLQCHNRRMAKFENLEFLTYIFMYLSNNFNKKFKMLCALALEFQEKVQ